MHKNTYPGKFIVLEGLDGSGQSTQAVLLQDYLRGDGRSVVMTKEPTGESEAGEKIKEILTKRAEFDPKALQLLFAEDRKIHLGQKIVPALQSGQIVISDRYFFSSFAFGSVNCDLDWLIEINNDFLLPDITFVLVVNPKISLERIEKRGKPRELFEVEDRLTKVDKIYKLLSTKFENYFLIDGEQSIATVHQNIVLKLKEVISLT